MSFVYIIGLHEGADYIELRRGESVPWNYLNMRKGAFTGVVFVGKYSGTVLTNQNCVPEEIKRRFNSGNAC